nr:uncharacterized protein CI109_007220 [Kwoniella shandongensis]KAA5524428.1 hypothetical protein CI109_007220 [Kwoniella shandongensis]
MPKYELSEGLPEEYHTNLENSRVINIEIGSKEVTAGQFMPTHKVTSPQGNDSSLLVAVHRTWDMASWKKDYEESHAGFLPTSTEAAVTEGSNAFSRSLEKWEEFPEDGPIFWSLTKEPSGADGTAQNSSVSSSAK